ncbi:hypothetical protein WSS15_21840 [Acetobacter pasteurianus]|uniref:hypothetical protein n=1 Tax=Acetobacter pasteurianus TaxID=438 RepID=UPI0022BB2280|nr:hypothetical protein [Acetobacter pasteurianus]GLH29534.1 hypothetical protein WSS15_21840 [Acetobacter pasteurianus]
MSGITKIKKLENGDVRVEVALTISVHGNGPTEKSTEHTAKITAELPEHFVNDVSILGRIEEHLLDAIASAARERSSGLNIMLHAYR